MSEQEHIAAAWYGRAEELAAWTEACLLNRTDAWGAYRPEHEIGREFTRPDGTRGKLGPQRTVKGRLTRALLVQHYQAHDRSAIIGLHTAGPENLSKGGALDIDHHGPASTAAEVNLRAALAGCDALVRFGFRPLLTESNGEGGYHLRLLFAEAMAADRLFHFLKSLTRDHGRLAFPQPPEQFPKQPDVRRCKKGLGNWLRLPGRHHKRPFFSRVWDGARWLEGHEAIDFILALRGDPPGLVPEVLPSASSPPPRRVHGLTLRAGGASLSARIAAYMAKLPHLSEGQGRDDVAFGFASFLVRDLALSNEIALGWLSRWDQGNRPPKGEDRLKEIIENAREYGQRPIGEGLTRNTTDAGHGSVVPGRRPGHMTLRCRVEVP
jgi:hypothetical protein